MNVLENIDTQRKGTEVVGTILIRTAEVRKTKTGSDYLVGTYNGNGEHGFKVWGGPLFEYASSLEMPGKVCEVRGTVDEYNGVKSLILSNIVVREDIDPMEFMDTPYGDDFINGFYQSIESKLSEEGKEILHSVLNTERWGRFKEEFAAISHHDAVPRGLIAHSMKVARITLLVTNMYPSIMRERDKDFYILAALLHDVGKIEEYHRGVFNEEDGWLTHRYFGVKIIEESRDLIIKLKGKDWYNRLISVITQHHGEWGERPQTVEAMVIHLIDNLEAQMTDISTAMADASAKDVRVNGLRLRL